MEELLININDKINSEVTQSDNLLITVPRQNSLHTNQLSPQNVPISTISSIGIQTDTVVQNRNTSHSSLVPIPIPIDQTKRDTQTTKSNHENIGDTTPNQYDGRTDWADYLVHFETVS